MINVNPSSIDCMKGVACKPCFWIFYILFCQLPAQEPATISLVGTDLFRGSIAERIVALGKPLGLQAKWPGSQKALQLLDAGKTDLAIVTSKSSKDIPEVPGMLQLPIAYRISRVFIAKDNPLAEISIDQLRAIFGNRAERRLVRWGGLGLTGDWRQRGIDPMVAERYTSFSREIFEHHVLPSDRLQSAVKVFPEEEALANAFKKNPGAIGVFASLHADTFGKSVPVASKVGEPFGATPENLYFGDYPLQMPFVVLFPKSRIQALAPVLRTLYSGEVAQAIFQSGLAPVPDNFRLAELKKLDL
jgi:ABC-type phosphate transport system substrate-binding protein